MELNKGDKEMTKQEIVDFVSEATGFNKSENRNGHEWNNGYNY
jgi:hypothetical protein